MQVLEQINKYITSQPEPKRSDMQTLHQLTLHVSPAARLKASVTGYCIKFKTLKDINIDTLEAAIRYGVDLPS